MLGRRLSVVIIRPEGRLQEMEMRLHVSCLSLYRKMLFNISLRVISHGVSSR